MAHHRGGGEVGEVRLDVAKASRMPKAEWPAVMQPQLGLQGEEQEKWVHGAWVQVMTWGCSEGRESPATGKGGGRTIVVGGR